MTAQNEIVNKKNAMRVGKTFEVLVERYEELFDRLRKDGFTRVRVNGETYDLSTKFELEKNKIPS